MKTKSRNVSIWIWNLVLRDSGIIGAGINRMNIYTVRRATQGLANYIIKQGGADKGVAIAFDSRHMSPEFAMEAAMTLAANGIKAYKFESLRPTPELSFAVRELGCIAGINITASHNPPEYNGYKVYWEDGAQFTPPHDKGVTAEVLAIEDLSTVKTTTEEEALKSGKFQVIGKEIDDKYIAQVKAQVVNQEAINRMQKDITIIYTPLHGTGNIPARRVMKEIGFENVYVVPEQELPNGDFPTVSYPNPEAAEAFELGLKLAKEKNADLVLATDPDADRLGVYVKDTKSGEYIPLTGNMSGSLLCDYVLSQKQAAGKIPSDGEVVKSIVTTNLVDAVAKHYGCKLVEVLTGFKYIGQQILKEETTGKGTYMFGMEAVSYTHLCTLTESPVYKNTGSYTVYYTVTKKNFDTISGSATVAITTAQLTVTAESKNVTYKDEPPVYSSTFEGFVNGENTEVLGGTLSYECAYAAGSDVAEYEIIPSGLTAENGNYEITYLPGRLTVVQAKPKFELRNPAELNRAYDAKNTAPEVWTDSDGNVTVTIKKGSEILMEAPMNAGTYTVEVHTEAGKNYEAGSQTFSFEIKKAPLSVKAVDQNVTVGDAIPEYTVLYEGFAGTDTADVLNGSLQFTCEYAPDSAAGDYAIQPSGLTSENYEILFENGTLYAVRRASSGSDNSDNSGGSGSTKNPAATNFGKNVSNSSSSENDAQGTWKRDNKGWWFEFKDGTYPAGEKTSDQNGEKLGWIQKDGKWWAFGSDGYLKRGWAQDNASGKWYLIDENTGMQTSWHYDESDQHWYYLDPASGAMLTGWQFINGKWYYLSKISGAVPLGSMYREIRTPDGYYVDKDGVWDGLETKEK